MTAEETNMTQDIGANLQPNNTTTNHYVSLQPKVTNQILNSSKTDLEKKDKAKISKSKKFKKIACTECRQQKAKCDAFEMSPNPCTRCIKRNIPCRLDSDFKRTFKRAKLDELVKEYEIIKSKLKNNPESITLKDVKTQSELSHYLKNPESSLGVEYNTTTPSPPLLSSLSSVNPSSRPQILPPLQSINTVSNTLNNRTSSTEGSTLPNPNTFYSSSQNPSISLPQSGSSRNSHTPPSLPPLPSNNNNNNLSKLSPYNIMNTSESPLNVNTYHTMPSRSEIPVSTATTPKLDNTILNSNMNDNYKLKTLISVANASVQTNPKTDALPTITQTPINLQWKDQNHAVERPMLTDSMKTCSPKTLGEVTLTEKQIGILYTTFATYYHPLLPVVDITRGIERIYRLCPVLFWTIMFTALRGHHDLEDVLTSSECHSLYFTLSPILKSVLAEISISPITRYAPTEVDEPILNASSVYSVQAFLIYTFWPPLTSSLSADSSWNTIGIAVYQAIRIGLHSPGHTSDRLKSNNNDFISEQVRTWIGCNIVSQTVGTVFGFPGFYQPYTSLSLAGIEIPKPLKQMLEIQTFEEQVEKTLNNNAFDPLRLNHASERLPMILLLENELNQLELRLCSDSNNPMDEFRALSLYASRLHLLSYHFHDNEHTPSLELKRGYIKTYNAALALIRHCQEAQKNDATFVTNLPNAYLLTIWQASVVIARLVNSKYKSVMDETAGKELYQVAISLILKSSIVKHDLSYRSCGIMKSTWNLFRALDQDRSGELKVSVKSRMSASIFFDTLWILREKCGMIKLRPMKEKLDTNESVESDSDVEVIDDDAEEEKKENKEEVIVFNQTNESRSHSKDSLKSSKKKSDYHLESTARRIISTIPLDPQPIGIVDTPHGSGSSSKQSSPYLSSYKSPPNADTSAKKIITPQSLVAPSQKSASSTNIPTIPANAALNSTSTVGDYYKIDVKDSDPTQAFLIDSWDIGNDLDSDMLFKDIESVMDEFGFHAEY